MLGLNINKIDNEYTTTKFQIAYDFLRNTDLNALESGKIELEDGLFCVVFGYETEPASKRRFETHERYYDLQYVISGQESFGLISRSGLEIDIPYQSETDIAFYKEPLFSGRVALFAGDFIVVAPDEAHKPQCDMEGSHAVKKLVIKIPV